jgi:hypothetical protein
LSYYVMGVAIVGADLFQAKLIEGVWNYEWIAHILTDDILTDDFLNDDILTDGICLWVQQNFAGKIAYVNFISLDGLFDTG